MLIYNSNKNNQNLLYPRIQIEVRFTGILNFYQINKTFLSPFVKFSQTVGTSNFGKINEAVTLNFEEENSQIDCRWDRLILISEGDSEIFLNSSFTPVKIFFDILQAYRNLSDFDEIANYILDICVLNIISKDRMELVSEIKSKFFTKELDNIIKDYDDISLNISKGDDTDEVVETYKFGLFLEKDINHFNLFPFSRNKIIYGGKYGKLMNITLFERAKKFDFKIFKEKLEFVNDKSNFLE